MKRATSIISVKNTRTVVLTNMSFTNKLLKINVCFRRKIRKFWLARGNYHVKILLESVMITITLTVC